MCLNKNLRVKKQPEFNLKSKILKLIRKMTNLDSMLKSRDIVLPTKVLLVKAMVFPVARYGCES